MNSRNTNCLMEMQEKILKEDLKMCGTCLLAECKTMVNNFPELHD